MNTLVKEGETQKASVDQLSEKQRLLIQLRQQLVTITEQAKIETVIENITNVEKEIKSIQKTVDDAEAKDIDIQIIYRQKLIKYLTDVKNKDDSNTKVLKQIEQFTLILEVLNRKKKLIIAKEL